MVTMENDRGFDPNSPFPTEACQKVSSDVIFVLNMAVKSVCDAFGVSADDLSGKSRLRSIIYARHAYASLITNVYNPVERSSHRPTVSLRVIGWRIHRIHSTIYHSSGVKGHYALMYSKEPGYCPYYELALSSFLSYVPYTHPRMEARVSEIDHLIVKLSSEKYLLLQRIEQQRL